MNNLMFKIKYGIAEFNEKFFSTKLFVIVLLQFFMVCVFLLPLREFSTMVNYPVSPWIIPFLYSDLYFEIFFMSAVIYYYSNVPFMQYSEMYKIIRTGRRKWAIQKIIGIIFSAIGLSIIEVLLSVIPLIGQMKIESGWGKVIHTLAMTDAAQQYGISLHVANKVLSEYSPLEAMLLIILISILVISFIGLLMFMISLFSNRLIAMFFATFFIILPIVEMNMESMYKWIIYISPVSWMNMGLIGTRHVGELPTLSYIITTLLGLIVILSILIICKIKTINFDWNREE